MKTIQFQSIAKELETMVLEWEEKFRNLNEEQITLRKNDQNRSTKQIIGHMIDSASNNTHRVIHLQYQESPLEFPNYATYGNNDRWIAIQNYQEEDWHTMIQFWKYIHLHFIHVINNIDPEKLGNEWLADKYERVSLQKMVEDFPRHFRLHISEIEKLLQY
jgi:hypothetical protein